MDIVGLYQRATRPNAKKLRLVQAPTFSNRQRRASEDDVNARFTIPTVSKPVDRSPRIEAAPVIAPQQAEHLILTRFNVRYSDEPVPRVLKDDWLEQRFELFERWCVPTIASQEGPTRRWLSATGEN